LENEPDPEPRKTVKSEKKCKYPELPEQSYDYEESDVDEEEEELAQRVG
jgi:hypothetical protein